MWIRLSECFYEVISDLGNYTMDQMRIPAKLESKNNDDNNNNNQAGKGIKSEY